jgi:hypothetical protein
VDAVRVKYVLSLTIPNTPDESFTTYAWLSDRIGFIKWEGNAAILNAFTRGSVNLSDTTSVISENLISYDVKQ